MINVLIVAFGMLVSSVNVCASMDEVPSDRSIPIAGKKVAFGIPFSFDLNLPSLKARCVNDAPKRDTINMLSIDVLPDFKQDVDLVSLFMDIQERAMVSGSFTLEKMCVLLPGGPNYDKNQQWLEDELVRVFSTGRRILQCEVRSYTVGAESSVQA